ncbi:hypothetical protein [Novosphingobium chloroacetimidivorans]|uniref:hypothetical protein n=1 Tax=Novosphingobium chloroacetimidivorans TaxID=1428314 RepID=UPI001617DF17|nr:hypothetical protein [Novosphingobium chloroacetimidivorans]
MDGLIGHTGFVGGNLVRQHPFAARFNSANVGELVGASFDTVVCAAAPGSMFEANRFAERDAARIDALIEQLDAIGSARRFVLVSTVAVLAGFAAEDEDTTAFETATPYGVNRRRLEAFVAERFTGALVVRLPALFGPVLKKNFLFDFMNPMPSMVPPAGLEQLRGAVGSALAPVLDRLYPLDAELGMHMIDRAALDASGQRTALEQAVVGAGLGALRFTNRESRFQFYDMRRLWRDIGLGLEHGLEVLHLSPPQLSAGEVHRAVTGTAMPESTARVHSEDMRTRHAALWGQPGPYMATREEVLAAVAEFVQAERVPA